MKRVGNLREAVLAWSNLVAAAQNARRGKRSRNAVMAFEYAVEYELVRLRDELCSRRYKPGSYRTFEIHEPKRRLISAAPYRDRVVHHAVCNVVGPILDSAMIEDSYACRVGKGTHAAVSRAREFCDRFRFVLKADIRKYFPSIDHSILKDKLTGKFKDPWVLELQRMIIDNSNPQESPVHYYPGDDLFTPSERRRGLPIGNLTSQLYANWMLNDVDHWVKHDLRLTGYIRYCDDMLLFADSSQELHRIRGELQARLATERLRLHEDKTVVYRTSEGVPFLGYRIFPSRCLLQKQNIARFRRRMRFAQEQFQNGKSDANDIRQQIRSWLGHVSHTQSYELVARTLDKVTFTRRSSR